MISQEPAEVTDLSQVERVLAAHRGGEGGGSVRATTLNLVAWAPTAEHVSRTQGAVAAIGASRPLRGIVVAASQGPARATVSTACWVGSGSQEVCSEQILIEAEPDALPSAVVPLLVPDLPVFLLWQGELAADSPALRELAEQADRLIVDSDESGLDAVDEVCLFASHLTDLAWTRLDPWRDAIAHLFDTAKARRRLDHLWGVEVEGPDNQARLLAGWLRSRLDRTIGLDRSGRSKRVQRVALRCDDQVFTVERADHGHVGRAAGPDVPEHPVVLSDTGWRELLASELDRLGSDRVFEQALAAAAPPAA